MQRNLKNTCLVAFATIYCWFGWLLMRHDYFTTGEQTSTTHQFVHLLCTFVMVLGVILWKGKGFERLIARLSALPPHQGVAPFLALAAVVFTMLYYPRGQVAPGEIGWGMMESTRMLVQQLFLAGAVIGAVLLAVLYLQRPAEALLQIGERLIFSSPEKVLVATAAVVLFLSANAVSLLQFWHLPVLPEEATNLFQARIFSTGRLFAQTPPLPDFFSFGNMIMTDKWYSPAPPGFPLLLALGFLIKAPWVINPLLLGLCVVPVYAIAKQMYGERVGRGSVMLMLVSPFMLFLSSLHLSHTSTALFLLLALFFLLKALEGAPRSHFLFSGLSYGGALVTAPLLGIAAGIPPAAYLAGLFLKRRVRLLSVIAIVVGAILPQAFFLFYSLATDGHFPPGGFLPMLQSGFDSSIIALPYGMSYLRAAQVFLSAIVSLNNRMHYFSVFLLGWPLPALMFAAVPFASASKNKWDYLLLAIFLAVPAGTFFLFQGDSLFGPRFYVVVSPIAVILIVRGLETLPLLWNRVTGANMPRLFPPLLIVCCIIFNLSYFLPGRLQFYTVSSYVFKLVPSPVQQTLDSAGIHNAVVFIDDFPFDPAYGAGFWRNDPSLTGDIVYARDREPHNRHLMAWYPSRKYYRYSYLAGSLEEVFPDSGLRVPVAYSGE